MQTIAIKPARQILTSSPRLNKLIIILLPHSIYLSICVPTLMPYSIFHCASHISSIACCHRQVKSDSDFHFYDLLHILVNWHVQSRTPLFIPKKLGGWNTLEIVKGYAHLNADYLSQLPNAVTIWSQNSNKNNQSLNFVGITD